MTPGAFDMPGASLYLSLAEGSRWLEEAPIPKVDMRLPGAKKPLWRWRRVDLDAFLEARVVAVGQASPWGQG